MEHSFTEEISNILTELFGEDGEQIFKNSDLLQYLKT